MFENMPQVPKGKYKAQQQSLPKRLPWILGVGGCLVLLLCVVLAGLGVGLWTRNGGAGIGFNPLAQGQNTGSQPTSSSTPVGAAASARGKVALRTARVTIDSEVRQLLNLTQQLRARHAL